jgi:asparagine synthase (glutamine-hydrolysing)
MAALAGVVGRRDAKRLLRRMAAVLRHRGAPETCSSASRWAACSLDVPEDGRPASVFVADDTACALAGEIYNIDELAREFGSVGLAPAAVLARAFRQIGPDVFLRLDGPFVLFLQAGDTFHLVRDPLGEKTAYYTVVEAGLLFASESKAFVADDAFVAKPNLGSLNKILTFSFIPGVDTMLDGVSELPPGHRLEFRQGAAPRCLRYWDLHESRERLDERSCVQEIRRLTSLAVDKRLGRHRRVAAFLSGGIDSSAVVAELAAKGVRVTALSASFGHGQPNELMYARMVAAHCGELVEHQIVDIEPAEFLPLLPKIMWQLDDPLCDCITVPNYVLAQRAAAESTIVFNGEGGDPLFGGPKNKFLILGEWYAFLGGYDRATAYLSSYHKFFDYLDALCTKDFLATTGGQAPLVDLVRPHLDNREIKHFLNRLMHLNIQLKGGQNILVKVEKMLGAHGVTPASPLFDRALTELSFSIPPELKRRGDIEKYAFKKAFEDKLPRAVVYRKKAGMGVPLNFWFKVTALRDYAMDLLLSKRFQERGYFNRRFVSDLLAGHGPANHIGQNRGGELLWMLLAVELWHRVYIDGERP